MSSTSPQYWRARKHWSTWVGRKGTVIASTLIHVGNPALAESTPYPYVLIDFGDEQCSFVGVGHEEFLPGETVECVWRKMGKVDPHEVIEYGIKVQRYTDETTVAVPQAQEITEIEVETQLTEPIYVPTHR